MSCQRFSIRHCGARVAKWLGHRICSLVVLGTSHPPCHTLDCCFVYSQLRPASCQLGFLQPAFIYNVWDQILHIDPKMSPVEGEWSILKVCKDIPTHTYLHNYYLIIIIKYNMLNQTYQSWCMFWQLVGGITDCESVTIYQRKKLLEETLKVQVCKAILHDWSWKYTIG